MKGEIYLNLLMCLIVELSVGDTEKLGTIFSISRSALLTRKKVQGFDKLYKSMTWFGLSSNFRKFLNLK